MATGDSLNDLHEWDYLDLQIEYVYQQLKKHGIPVDDGGVIAQEYIDLCKKNPKRYRRVHVALFKDQGEIVVAWERTKLMKRVQTVKDFLTLEDGRITQINRYCNYNGRIINFLQAYATAQDDPAELERLNHEAKIYDRKQMERIADDVNSDRFKKAVREGLSKGDFRSIPDPNNEGHFLLIATSPDVPALPKPMSVEEIAEMLGVELPDVETEGGDGDDAGTD